MAFVSSPIPTVLAPENVNTQAYCSAGVVPSNTLVTTSTRTGHDVVQGPLANVNSSFSARQRRRTSTTTYASATTGWQQRPASLTPTMQPQQPQVFEAALRKWSNAAADRKEQTIGRNAEHGEDATSMLLGLRPDYVGEAISLGAQGHVEDAVNVLFDATCIADNAAVVSETLRGLLRVVVGFAALTGRAGATQPAFANSAAQLDNSPQAFRGSSRRGSTTLNSPGASNPFRRPGGGGAHASPASWRAHAAAAARQLAARSGTVLAGAAAAVACTSGDFEPASPQALAEFMESPGGGWTSHQNGNTAFTEASGDEPPNGSMASVASIAFAAPQHTVVAQVGEELDDGTSELNQYVLLQPVGRGKQGEVFLAMDTEKNELRAIKVVKRPKGAASGPSAGGPLARARDRQRQQLEREVAIMKRCRHRNVVALYEVIDDPELDCMYLVMQYVEHGPLVKVQRDGTADRTLSPAALAGYARQLCSGLLYLHKHGVIHRDIKPDNILLGQNDQVYLADFGMAEVFDEGAMTTSNNVHGTRGTIAFMAPELLSTTESTAVEGEAVDVWALGITFYVLLFGRLPWEFTDLRSLLHKIETVPVKFPSPPEGAHSLSRQNVRSVPVDDGSLNAAPPPHPPAHGDPAHSAGPLVRAATAATVSLDAATKPRVTFGTPELLPDSAVCEAASSSDFTPPAISEDDDDDEYVFEATRRRSSHRQDNDNSHSRTRATRTKPAGRPATRYSVSEIRARPYRCGWRPIIAGMLERAPADRTPLATVRRQVASLHAALREHGDAPVGTDVGVCPTAFFSDGGAARHHYGSITAVRRTSFAAARIEY